MPNLAYSGRELSAAARKVDAELQALAAGTRFLLEVTPTNVEQAWEEFAAAGYRGCPAFEYRPLPPNLQEHQQRLERLSLAEVRDPGVHELLEEQRDWLIHRLNMLKLRNRPRFRSASVELYGGVDDNLLHLARGLLMALDEPRRKIPPDWIHAEEMCSMAQALLDVYQREVGDTAQRCRISPDVEGLVVSNGVLHISDTFGTVRSRAEALLAHEVGTHVVTYLNAQQQPLRILSSGLAAYDELQEGLAVVSEYVVGGLSKYRMRTIAARVLAVRAMLDGAELEDVFHLLNDSAELTERQCFVTAMRVFRAGGFTKDAVYLRGVRAVLKYLGTGGDLAPLLVGKIGMRHVAVIDLLIASGLLQTPRLIPLHFTAPQHQARMEALSEGLTVTDLVERRQ